MSTDSPQSTSRLDEATASRLARLRTMPVDTTRLEQALRAGIGPAAASAAPRRPSVLWSRPWRAVAAALVVLAAIAAVLLSTADGPAMASSAQMARMHEDLVAGRMPSVQVDSVEDANRVLAEKSPQCPEIPDVPRDAEQQAPPDAHVMACCMKSVKDKQVACLLLRSEGVPVTMVVANASDMRSPESPTRMRDGVTYHVQSHGLLQMVMTERHGRWVCLIGEVPADRLMDLASELEF